MNLLSQQILSAQAIVLLSIEQNKLSGNAQDLYLESL